MKKAKLALPIAKHMGLRSVRVQTSPIEKIPDGSAAHQFVSGLSSRVISAPIASRASGPRITPVELHPDRHLQILPRRERVRTSSCNHSLSNRLFP